MGKITYEEFMNMPKVKFQDYILSKHNVKILLYRLNLTVIYVSTWPLPQISLSKLRKFIFKLTKLEASLSETERK